MHFTAICCDISQNRIWVIHFFTDKALIYKHIEQVHPKENATYIRKQQGELLRPDHLLLPHRTGHQIPFYLEFQEYKIKDGENEGWRNWTGETISGCSQMKAAEKAAWYLANQVAVASHATAQGKCYMAFLGLPLFLVLYSSSSLHMRVLESHSGKKQWTQITSEPHSYKLNVTGISSTNVLVLEVNTSRKELRRVHKY